MDSGVSLYQAGIDSWQRLYQRQSHAPALFSPELVRASASPVLSAPFLALLPPHTHFRWAMPIPVDAKFPYWDSLGKRVKNRNISTSFPFKKEEHTEAVSGAWGWGGPGATFAYL